MPTLTTADSRRHALPAQVGGNHDAAPKDRVEEDHLIAQRVPAHSRLRARLASSCWNRSLGIRHLFMCRACHHWDSHPTSRSGRTWFSDLVPRLRDRDFSDDFSAGYVRRRIGSRAYRRTSLRRPLGVLPGLRVPGAVPHRSTRLVCLYRSGHYGSRRPDDELNGASSTGQALQPVRKLACRIVIEYC
jgi:hypothetical protein